MHEEPIKQTVQQLSLAGKSMREISCILNMSRNTVRAILKGNDSVDENNNCNREVREQKLIAIIVPLIKSCCGNLVRVREILSEEYQQELAYSTLTNLVRKSHLRGEQSKRFGEYIFEPGDEMQHDTSPHNVIIGGKTVKAQCASLILGFSRKIFIQYYPCFTRFEAKVFLTAALEFMQGSCRRCIIDNTSVLLAAGAGKYAVIAPEFTSFGRFFGFEFTAHAVNDPNRKGKVERQFYYAETNFLAGRVFSDWDDLNSQVLLWCDVVANSKPKRSLGMSPDIAYIQEKPYLLMLPPVMPPVYKNAQRIADTQGYINIDSNRYSIPEAHIGHSMDICQYIDKIDIYYQNKIVATHQRIVGLRDQRAKIKEHHPTLNRLAKRYEISEAEKHLTNISPILDAYLLALKSHVRGRGMWAFKQLLNLKQLYPTDAFLAAIEQAGRYGLYDMKRIETMILKEIDSDFFNI